MMRNPADEAVRLQALDPTQSFIVQAPAGSGKTELLIQRFLVLLSHVHDNPEGVLAITFTRKAASEMRQRVIEALSAARDDLPCATHEKRTRDIARSVLEKDVQYHWQLIDNPHRLRIQTIDSLCASIVGHMPLLSKIGGQARVSENPSTLYEQAAINSMMQSYDDQRYAQALTHLLTHLDNRLEYVQRLLSQMLATREQWLPYLLDTHRGLRDQLEQALQALILSQLQASHAALSALPYIDELIACIGAASDYCAKCDPANPLGMLANIRVLPEVKLDNISAWQTLVSFLLKADDEFRQTVNINQGFPAASALKSKEDKAFWKTLKSQYCDLLETLAAVDGLAATLARLKMIPQPSYEPDQWTTLDALITLMPIAAAELLLVFQQRGEVDFSQISQAAINALGHEDAPSDLALALDQKLEHILVDEFQDTSINHCQLLMRLTAGWQAGDGRTLFIVGDPMQSIYRFRQARVDLFIQARRYGLGNIPLTPLTLTVNFRSSPTIVNWNNRFFDNIFPKNDNPNLSAISYSCSEAFSNDNTDCAIQTHFQAKETAQTSAKICDIIRYRQQTAPDESIAVLVRSRSHLEDTLSQLRLNNIPYQAGEIEPLASQAAIQDCFALTCALAHPAENIAWMSVLRAPWCGLTLTDCHHLAHANVATLFIDNAMNFRQNNNLSTDAKSRLTAIMPVIQTAFAQLHACSLSHVVYATWLSLGGPATLQHESDIEHAQRYFQLLEQFELSHHYFDKFAFNKILLEEYLPQPAQQNNDFQPVEVMTIHKSKGLEFDTVIIPGLDRYSHGNAASLLTWTERFDDDNQEQMILAPIKSVRELESALFRYINDYNRQKDMHEMARLLYVATTRAKKNLHLLATCSESGKPAKSSMLAMLWPYFTEDERQFTTLAANTHKPVKAKANTLRRFTQIWYEQSLPCKPVIKPMNPQQYTPQPLQLNVPSIVGSLIHEIIQHMIQGTVIVTSDNIEHFHPIWARQLAELPEDVRNAALIKVDKAIENCLQSEIVESITSSSQQSRRAEYPLSACIDSQITHYRVDYTFVDDSNVRWVVDFKTSEPNDGESVEDFLNRQRDLYAEQLLSYAGLFPESEGEIRLMLYFPLLDEKILLEEHLVSELSH